MLDEAKDIILRINGVDYENWISASVTKSIQCLCGEFTFTASGKGLNDMPAGEIHIGDACEVFISGQIMITGYVDKVSISMNANERLLTVTGRDKTQDLVDCSAEVDAYEFLGEDLMQISSRLCSTFSIPVEQRVDVGKPFVKFVVQPSESAFRCIERAAKQRGVLCTSSCSGSLVLCKHGDKQASDKLVEGENIKSISVDYDYRDRFSKYSINGQLPSFEEGGLEPKHDEFSCAFDTNIKRYRPCIINGDTYCDADSAKSRADFECALRAGKSSTVNVTVVGWRQSSGELWDVNLVTSLEAPSVFVHGSNFITSSVTWSISNQSGMLTTIDLVRPDAFLDFGSGEVEEDFFSYE